MENLIVLLIVLGAAFFIGRNFYQKFKGKRGCNSGCSCGSEVKVNCSDSGESFQGIDIKK